MENKDVVLSVKNLAVSFKTDRGIVHAVRGVSFDLYKGETLCIVGESGSGKSVTNKAIMGISAANAIIENGSIMYEGEDLIRVSEEEFHRIRGHKIGMIFQDPLSALNPVMKIGKQITEATLINRNILKKHYNELISKELIKYRNAITNYEFDINKKDNEEENLKKFETNFKKLNKKADKNAEAIETLTKEIEKYISDTKVFTKNEIARLTEKEETLFSSINELKESNASEVKIHIAEAEYNNNHSLVELLKSFDEKSKNASSSAEFINIRKDYLKSLGATLKANYKNLKPLVKEDLKIRKKEAKVENEAYYQEIKKAHDDKISELKERLNALKVDFESYKNTLSEEEKAKAQEINLHNELAIKKMKKIAKKSQDKNISKTSKDEDLEILPTGISKYDEFVSQINQLEADICSEDQDFINKTKITKAEAKRMALEVMKEVGIPLAEKRFKQYPFEFSGGMRQRIVIAIALTANPEILICDEPTTALDVTIQAQILELINRLKEERNLSCIFITHDLGVVANMADRVAVMYAGKIVEYGLAEEIFFNPKHPYTWALLSSIPDIDSKEKLEAIPGTPPDMLNPPEGDAFALRSKYAMSIDFKYAPPYFKISDTHYAASWLLYPGAPEVEMPAIVKTRIQNALKEQKEKIEKEDIE